MKPDAAARNLAYYDAQSAGREDYWRYMAAPRERMRVLLALLAAEPPSSLVDLGCGSGLLLDAVGQRLPSTRLAGIDLSPRQVESNRQRWPQRAWYVADLARPLDEPIAAGTFAAVVAAEVIEHVEDPGRLLANALRLAEPGGRLLLTTQSGPLRPTELSVGHRRHFTAAEMRELLVAAGWSVERAWNSGYPFHDLSKWWANRRPDATLDRFGSQPYGSRERLICAALRLLFRFNSRRRGAQLMAVARRPAGPQGTVA